MLDILVLEDQPAVREVISEVVGGLEVPISVGKADSLKEAREMFASKQWNCLVTDLSLGDGISLDLIAELREANNKIPIILVSGFLSPSRLEEARKLNVEHVLAKPFDPEMLLECLREALIPKESAQELKSAVKRKTHTAGRLLPEMFEMDRKLGLLYRMFDEMPKYSDVSRVCGSALELAMEMIHAQRGYLALFDRNQEKLVMVADNNISQQGVTSSCSLSDTPFKNLIHKDEEFLEVFPVSGDTAACWPDVDAEQYVAIPVSLQGVHMGVLCLIERAGADPLKTEEKHLLGLLVKKLDTLLDNRAVHAALAESMRETLIALVRSLEARDRYTKDHSSRVSQLSVLIAREMGVDEETGQLIRTGGLLHDIGKVGIADQILLKPGRYSDNEYAIMKAHPAIGDAILKNMDALVRERLMVRHHHERWDGHGYPDRLGEEDIPFEARIVCVADAIDAMTTHRVYRMARPLSFCLEQLKHNSGTQFDSQVVEAAVSAIERGAVQTQAKVGEFEHEGLMPMMSFSDIAAEIPVDLGVR
ncbi:MAG: HD domain-containing phosphohydrolase [Mariprofundaceae bacterium]